jgi:hypothetical protein
MDDTKKKDQKEESLERLTENGAEQRVNKRREGKKTN